MAKMFLARYQRKLHVVVWVMSPEEESRYGEELHIDLDDKGQRDLVNRFMVAKDPYSLMCAIREFGKPMMLESPEFDASFNAGGKRINRLVSIKKFQKIRSKISEASRQSLASECAFYMPSAGWDSVKESSARRVIAEFGGVGNGALDSALSELESCGGMVVIEPLNDWAVLRSCFQLQARLRYVLERAPKEIKARALEESGFKKVEHDGAVFFQAPMFFNTVRKDETLPGALGSAIRDLVPFAEDGWLFWCQYAMKGNEEVSTPLTSYFSVKPGEYVNEKADIRILTAPQATGEKTEFNGWQEYDDKRLYYAVNATGCGDDQRSLAEKVAETQVGSMLDSGSMRVSVATLFEGTLNHALVPQTLEGALWRLFADRGSAFLKGCPECGCAFFAVKSTKSNVCSVTCRNRHANASER